MTPEYAEKLTAQQEKARAYKSSHTYSAEHYGLTQQDILENYREIFDHYGFDKEP
jgi:hypothetical protein